MEKDGIIKRKVTNDSPPRVEYFLTDNGGGTKRNNCKAPFMTE
ncbi:MAG: winged helix-turn-helix transcriptional regulator [Nitrososphaeria archaeon]